MSRRAAPAPLPVTVLRGHSSGVQAVCFLNENTLLSGSQDGSVKVWDLERRRACAEFQATSYGNGVQRLDRLGRGRVVSQGRDMLINVWDAERLASAGDGGGGSGSGNGPGKTIAPEPLQQLSTGAFHFCQFALTRWREEGEAAKENENTGADSSSSSSGGGACEDGDVGRRRETNDRRGHREENRLPGGGEKDPVAAPAAAAAAAAAAAPKPSPTPLEQAGGEASTEGPCFSDSSAFQENVMLAPCWEQHSVSLWDLRKGKPAFTFAPKDADRRGMVMCARLLGESPSCASPFAVTGHDSGHLCVYDLRATSAEPLLESRLHTAPLLCVDVGSSCEKGVSGSADESIKVFRLSTRKASCEVVKTFSLEHPGTSCVEIRRDQKLFVSGGWDHRCCEDIYFYIPGRRGRSWHSFFWTFTYHRCVRWPRCPRTQREGVRAFSWKSPRPLAVLRSHEKNVHAVAYSPRTGGLVSGSGDSRVAVWELFPSSKESRSGDGATANT